MINNLIFNKYFSFDVFYLAKSENFTADIFFKYDLPWFFFYPRLTMITSVTPEQIQALKVYFEFYRYFKIGAKFRNPTQAPFWQNFYEISVIKEFLGEISVFKNYEKFGVKLRLALQNYQDFHLKFFRVGDTPCLEMNIISKDILDSVNIGLHLNLENLSKTDLEFHIPHFHLNTPFFNTRFSFVSNKNSIFLCLTLQFVGLTVDLPLVCLDDNASLFSKLIIMAGLYLSRKILREIKNKILFPKINRMYYFQSLNRRYNAIKKKKLDENKKLEKFFEDSKNIIPDDGLKYFVLSTPLYEKILRMGKFDNIENLKESQYMKDITNCVKFYKLMIGKLPFDKKNLYGFLTPNYHHEFNFILLEYHKNGAPHKIIDMSKDINFD